MHIDKQTATYMHSIQQLLLLLLSVGKAGGQLPQPCMFDSMQLLQQGMLGPH